MFKRLLVLLSVLCLGACGQIEPGRPTTEDSGALALLGVVLMLMVGIATGVWTWVHRGEYKAVWPTLTVAISLAVWLMLMQVDEGRHPCDWNLLGLFGFWLVGTGVLYLLFRIRARR